MQQRAPAGSPGACTGLGICLHLGHSERLFAIVASALHRHSSCKHVVCAVVGARCFDLLLSYGC